MLQFITNSPTIEGTINQALNAINGGCLWVQVRMKNSTTGDISAVLDAIGTKCAELNVTLIVDDHVDLALRDDVSGVHLGQNDLSIKEARYILGPNKIIGLTVNTKTQALKDDGQLPDYYGVGPWRFTSTKSILSPVLGADGVKEIVEILKSHNPSAPIVAIGGITTNDVRAVLNSGADGVAVSGAISSAENPVEATKIFLKQLKKNKSK